MWIISILPDAAIHLIFILGILGTIAGFVLGFIPFVKTYQFAIQICSIVILVFGVYLEGGLSESKEWELKVKEMEAKGQAFDSDLHEAIANIPAPEEALKGKVVDDVEKGYYLNDKVLRYAKVVVGQ